MGRQGYGCHGSLSQRRHENKNLDPRIRLQGQPGGCGETLTHLNTRQIERVSDPAQADLAWIHTCTVTHKADRDTRKTLGSLARRHPDLPVIVAGCGVRSAGDELEKYKNISQMVGPARPAELARCIEQTMANPGLPSGWIPSPFSRPGSPAGISQGAGWLPGQLQLLHHPQRTRPGDLFTGQRSGLAPRVLAHGRSP